LTQLRQSLAFQPATDPLYYILYTYRLVFLQKSG